MWFFDFGELRFGLLVNWCEFVFPPLTTSGLKLTKVESIHSFPCSRSILWQGMSLKLQQVSKMYVIIAR